MFLRIEEFTTLLYRKFQRWVRTDSKYCQRIGRMIYANITLRSNNILTFNSHTSRAPTQKQRILYGAAS